MNGQISSGLLTSVLALVVGASLLACPVLTSGPASAATELENKANKARKQLQRYKQQLKRTRARQKGVEHNVSILDEERSRLNKLLISTARRVQDGEGMLSRIELRLGELSGNETKIRSSLAQRHGKIATLLASMQRIGRQPPPVIFTQRADALKMVRSAMLLRSLYPQLKGQADELATKLTALVRVSSNIRSERNRLKKQSIMLNSNRVSIKKLMSQKKARLAARKSQLLNLRNVTKLHTKSVSSLSELITKLNKEIAKNSRLGQYEKKLAGGKAGKSNKKLAFLNPARIEPAVEFAKTRGVLPLPVSGKKIQSFGDNNKIGSRSKGMVIETRAKAQVTAPSDGWIVYAGKFRRYGNLLIINAGGGYHILLAGMERIDVVLGQFVLAGEPVALMGAKKASGRNTKIATHESFTKKVLAKIAGVGRNKIAGKPLPSLYIEFRKKGRPINPAPWWIKATGKTGKEKV
ncbi:MAG: peptidoglycan DD-metalloendopeptidase family protein [bacterium]|nr:peptidoglycan DD-metalloendopeptidase family protein [bacterium]